MNKQIMSFVLLLLFSCLVNVHGEDPYITYEWKVTYGTISPLGVPQQVIMINGQFPGPKINCTSNNNIIVNVINQLDEPFLITWKGIQQRKNSWQDGTLGTNCPIPSGKNFTYHFQVKDQIGTYYYHPTTALHKSAGGYGPITIYSRALIPVPFAPPADDFTVLVSDWFTKSHKTLKGLLDTGRSLGRPDGIIINGKSGKGDGKDEPMFTMVKGKTYRFRFCNVGMKDTINVRIQKHTMKLVEMEGSHTVQNMIVPGRWKPEMRQNYNLLDAVSRSTIQVYPNSWAAILTTLDNAGTWNLRSNSLERHYLGHQLYFSVYGPNTSLKDEYNMPDNDVLCGLIKNLPKPKPYTI